MDPDKLRALVAFLRESGVTYYKDASVELILGPVNPVAVKLEETPVEPLPPVYKKLPKNYSNPYLFPPKRDQ